MFLPGLVPTMMLRAPPTALVEADGNDSFTKILLHFDAPAGGVVHVDTSPSNRGVAVVATSAATSAIQARFGTTSLSLNGTNQYLQYPDHADFDVGSGDFTIDMWIWPLSNGVQRQLVGQGDASGTDASTNFRMGLNASNVMFGFVGGSANAVLTGTTKVMANSGWHHVALVRDGNTIRMFLDGFQEASASFIGSVTNATSNFSIGIVGAFSSQLWNGYIDEFRFSKGVARWKTAFTPPTQPYGWTATDQADEYTFMLLHGNGVNATTIIPDYSPRARGNASLGGNTQIQTAQFKFGGSSIYFDGNGDYLYYADHPDWFLSTKNFTIDLWIRCLGLPGAGQANRSILMLNHSGSANDVWFFNIDNNGALYFQHTVSGANAFNFTTSNGVITVNTWKHVALVRNGSSFRVYVDGVDVGGGTYAGALPDYNNALLMGTWVDGVNNSLFAHLNEIRLSIGIARWTANFTPPTAPYNL